MQQFIHFVLDHWALCAFLLTCVIQVTPIFRCNPITALFSWIGKVITKDVNKRLDAMEVKLSDIQNDVDVGEIDRIRYEVLSFANSCRNKIKHTKSEYEHIINLTEKYTALLAKHHMTNGVFSADYAYIQTVYQDCLKNNDFLA